ncbi:hypothetical protein Syun_028679 [Stephania yunnanensis]|uniref:POPLD domain-containing protein n=1 Tax=Stephania yunnanensis TaxID=152371 RepID=A0AAP0E6M4_9MAGN
MVLVSSYSDDRGMKSTSILSGVCYGSAMLHYVGAPSSEVIGPVTYMWRPCMSCNDGADHEESHGIDGLGASGRSSPCSSFRQLWIWIHAAAFSEGFDSLQIACQKHMSEAGTSVNCLSLDGRLAQLEVMGENAMKYLQQVLHHVPRASDGPTLKRCSVSEADSDTHLEKSFIFEQAVHLPSHSIISLTVKDPRVLPNKNIEFVSEESPVIVNGDVLEEKSDNSLANIKQSKDKDKVTDEASILYSWLKDEANNTLLSDNKELWEIGNVVTPPPVDENFLCVERHRRRMKFFQLDNTSSALPSAETAESAGLCPILLLKNNNQKGVNVGWSIILPLSWVKAFWIPLVTRGVHAIGLREKHWIASDVGLPYFPFDFPDTNAYSSFMATQATASDQLAERRPLAMRPFRVPIPPPWNCIRSTYDLRSTSIEETQAAGGQVLLAEASPGTKNCDLESSEPDSSLFKGFFVIRTSNILRMFLNYIYGNNNVLLFPNALIGKKAEFFKAQEHLSFGLKGATHIPFDRKLCFVRVCLYAYKDGAFEEGSVVCAPHPADIELWTSRSDEAEGLQIPQSSVASYFIQQPSDEWQLNKPENPAAAETHRLPIGFVTSGFVRGSSKPAAVALCETGLLAQLRREQWESVQVKHRRWEIFVLVRNLRSSAYRLALATIVLEIQEDDLSFL